MANSITGRITHIFEAKNVGKTKPFYKREFIVDTAEEGDKYPNPVKLELVKDDVALIDKYAVGDTVTAGFFVNGRYWKNPKTGVENWFVSLRVNSLTGGAVEETFEEAEGEVVADDSVDCDPSDIPF